MKKEDLKKIISEGMDDLKSYRSKRKKGVEERIKDLQEQPKVREPVDKINWQRPNIWGPGTWVRAVVLLGPTTPMWVDSDAPGALKRAELYDLSPRATAKRQKAGKRLLEFVDHLANIVAPNKMRDQQLREVVSFIKVDLFPKWSKFCVKYLKKPETFPFNPAYLLAATDPLKKFIEKERTTKIETGWTHVEDGPKPPPIEWEL